MKNLSTVFQFEFRELIRKKAMIISTSLIAILLFITTFTPRIIALFSSDDTSDEPAEEEVLFEDVLVVSEDEELLSYIEFVFQPYEELNFSKDVNEVKELIEDESYDTAFVLSSETSYTVVKKDMDLDFSDEAFENILYEASVEKNLSEMGIDPAEVSTAENTEIQVEYETLGKDAGEGFVFGFGFLFVLYFLILMYGQLVANSVAREKDSRTMELLITSTNPKTLIIGKVFATGLASLLQVALIGLAIFIGFMINQSTYPEIVIEMLSGNLSMDVLFVYLVFSFSGYILYLFIYAALGSLVSKVEDVGSAVTPITFLFIGAYLIATTAMSTPNSTMVRVSSFVPFVSLFTMPIRYMMTSIPTVELLISFILMGVVIILIALLSIYIYRMGSLNYGNRMKLWKVLRNLVRRKKA